jgi:hypothetical protein
MQIGIDWVSMGIFLVAYALSQVSAIPIKLRYLVLAAACAAIAVFRLRLGMAGVNAVFTGLAGALAVYYVIRALGARDQPKHQNTDDD